MNPALSSSCTKCCRDFPFICGIKSEVHPWLMRPYVIWRLLGSPTYFSLLCSNHPQLPEGSPQAKRASKTRSCTFSAWELFLLCCPRGLLCHFIQDFVKISSSSERPYLAILFQIALHLYLIQSFLSTNLFYFSLWHLLISDIINRIYSLTGLLLAYIMRIFFKAREFVFFTILTLESRTWQPLDKYWFD